MLKGVSGGRVEVAVKSIVSEILSRMSRLRVSAEYSDQRGQHMENRVLEHRHGILVNIGVHGRRGWGDIFR
jgi:hypothetical protein